MSLRVCSLNYQSLMLHLELLNSFLQRFRMGFASKRNDLILGRAGRYDLFLLILCPLNVAQREVCLPSHK